MKGCAQAIHVYTLVVLLVCSVFDPNKKHLTSYSMLVKLLSEHITVHNRLMSGLVWPVVVEETQD